MANFPSSIPSYAGFTSSHTLSQDNHASQHNSEQGDITAIATKIGTGASTPTNGAVLVGNGTGTSAWRTLTGADVGFNLTTVLQAVYPVGCIYAETTGVNPNTTFGFGVWAQTGQGRVLVGQGTSDQTFTAGSQGGESNHTLTSNEMPSHTHTVTDPGHQHPLNGSTATRLYSPDFNNSTAAGSGGATWGASAQGSATTGITNQNTGGGTSHNNLPPYQVIYYWQRNA